MPQYRGRGSNLVGSVIYGGIFATHKEQPVRAGDALKAALWLLPLPTHNVAEAYIRSARGFLQLGNYVHDTRVCAYLGLI